MRNILLPAAAASAALLVLAGCNSSPEVLNSVEPDTTPRPTANMAPPPPPSVGSKAYRCAQPSNTVYYVEFYGDNTAMIRRGDRNAEPTRLTGTAATGPFTGEGYTLSGNGNNVTINGQSCRA